MRYDEEFFVGRPVSEVFEYLANAERIPEWAVEFARVEKVGREPVAKGSQFRLFRDRPPKAEWVFEWMAFEPERRLEWEARSSAPVVRRGSYTVGLDGGARTKVNVVFEPSLRGPARFLAPLLGRRLRSHARRDIGRLRERLGAGLGVVAGFLSPVADWADVLLLA